MNISKHISLIEATKSQTATRRKINNDPDPDTIARMIITAEAVFEPVREHFGVPIAISSFYRCDALNKAVGGSKTSQHVKGEAIDIDGQILGKVTNKEIFNFIKDNLEFDQLIWEFGTLQEPAWVHVSYRSQGNRKQIIIKS